MRLRQILISAVLMFLAISTARAALTPTDPVDPRPDAITDSRVAAYIDMNLPLPVAPSPLIAEDKVVASAYYDTISILSAKNNCSDFFGGPEAAVEVFNQMIGQVKKEYGSAGVAMEMSGSVSNVLNFRTKRQSRVFSKVKLNANGPFYRRRPNVEERVGSYQPNTREARVLIFLHEMGHVVRGADGNWLLPNDGNDEALSKHNSNTIESICGDAINGLGTSAAATLLARRVKAEEQFSKVLSASPPEQ
ncbi:MAG: hypothetical protein ABI596_03475 [Pyrinomonadaceae bacterium]